jgi:hypothetical protein
MRADRILALLVPIALSFGACSFEKMFERDDPGVERARAALDAPPEADADLQAARVELEELLRFRCENDGGRDMVLDYPNAALDLGLVMFRLTELIGRRFGEEELPDGGVEEGDELVMEARARQLDCAHLLLLKIASDPKTPLSLQLRARYLLGNMAFLAKKYKDAIARYDEVLLAHPARGVQPNEAGPPNDDDAVARYAAWNRAIALERLERNDAGPDADSTPDSNEGGDGASDGNDGSSDSSDSNDGSDGNDGSDSNDGGGDGSNDTAPSQPDSGGNDGGTDSGAPPPAASSSAAPMPSSSVAVDLRELDRFDQKAPLDLDFKARVRERKKLPKKLDK